MTIPFEIPTLIIAAVAVCAGYMVFGITAFGAALITVPVLSHFYPLDFLLPILMRYLPPSLVRHADSVD